MIFCQILVFLIELEISFHLRAWSLPPSHVGAIVETIAGLAAGQSVRNHFRVHGPHCNKRLTIFPSPTGMSPTELSQEGNNLIILCQEEFGW
jgi:hypothetical protein